MIDAPIAVSVGQSHAPASISGYRIAQLADAILVVAVAIHVNMAEEAADAVLVDALSQVLSSVPAAGAAPDPSTILRTMNDTAAGTGRYYSAAVVRWCVGHADATRCGRAAVAAQDGAQIQVLLSPEVYGRAGRGVLTNALGIPSFQPSGDIPIGSTESRIVIGVDGELDASAFTAQNQVATTAVSPSLTASALYEQRGGIVLLLDPSPAS